MPFDESYIVTSLRYPGKVYTSIEEFWADCEPEVTNAADANAAFKADGRILSTSSVLNEDGLSLTYTKTWFDEEASAEYDAEHASAITENDIVCEFTPI
jgi:hypothetical protein